MTAKKKAAEIDEQIPATSVPELGIVDMKDGRTRIRVQFDITYKGNKNYTVDGESATEPDLTMTLSQLLERHSRGREIPMKEPIFFQTEIPTFNDLTDVERYREQLERRLQETDEFLKNEVEQINAAKADEKKPPRQKTLEEKIEDAEPGKKDD